MDEDLTEFASKVLKATLKPGTISNYVAYSVVMLSTIYIIHASNISYLFLC